MSILRAVRSLSIGLLLAILVLGLLPFLFIESMVEISGMTELYATPLLLLKKFIKSNPKKPQ